MEGMPEVSPKLNYGKLLGWSWVDMAWNLHAKVYTYYPCNFFFGIGVMMHLQVAVVTYYA